MQTIALKKVPRIVGTYSLVGEKEAKGRLKDSFDSVMLEQRFGKKTWEQAESSMQKQAVGSLISRTNNTAKDIDMIFGGDLLNQCIGTCFGLMDYNIPFLGIYGACSTFCEGLLLSSVMVDGGYAKKVIAVSSSHFCSSERQFRYPLEYGGQRPPTAQWTVTASGSALVSDKGSEIGITHITPGKIVDAGISDANNMGAAMAPAAVDTILAHFKDRKLEPDYFDMVVTGDLGKVGSKIAFEQLKEQGIDLKDRYFDCGVMMFTDDQDTHAGGSGCGCCASVFSGHIFNLLKKGEIKRVLLTATGALMSTTSSFQGESIPSIAHSIAIERVE